MNRRRYLAALGITVGAAGCLNSGSSDDDSSNPTTSSTTTAEQSGLPTDTNPNDGYAPADTFSETPSEPSVDTDSFETLDRDGTTVPLVPIDVAYDWYRRRTARFADARGERSYQDSHVFGAVLSTVQTPLGPVADWPRDDFIVTYCKCPHHLSSMRAATLIEAGYEEVYAIDEGFGVWQNRGYPMAGQQVSLRPPERLIRGDTAPADAGGDAWAWHDPTGQREAVPIASDGSYELALKFADVDDASVIRVETPSYTVEGALGELTSGRVTAADAGRY